MIDELDLAFDERSEKGRHRRGYVEKRKGGKGRRSGRGKTVAALLLTLVLLGGLAGGAWLGIDRIQGLFTTPDYPGPGTGEAIVQINDGDTITDVGNTLVRADVVKSAKAYVKAAEDNSRAKNIGAGTYKVRKQMKAADVVALLLDPKTRIVNGVTIPEGRTAKQTYDLLSKHTKIPAAEFEAAAKDPEALGVPEFWFTRTDGKRVTKSIEGFLFPDTYEFPPNTTADGILRIMVKNFLDQTAAMKFVETVESQRGGISPYEVLIVASMAQAEAGKPEDLGKVAKVAYNRIYSGNFPCSCLEFDVSVNYYWELTGKPTKASKDMTTAEIRDPKNPYSTHANPGLTPTPINNPGKLALEGAMSPPDGKWLFFVAVDKQGTTKFAETNAEHDRNVQEARENGVL
ncbi:endolytic transglycosylase MltG [Plantactinospora sp. GCM10030261]|uniref:endolytic transglycosylase MltG n=1 Tax=Plantactinospora sp. GCM10030261 TaxID=3273420 RepID=UPI003623CD50